MTNVHLENPRISKQFYLILWIEYALIYMTKNCFNAAMADIVYEGVLTKTQTGLISAVFYIFYGPLQIVGGMMADRHNPEKLIKIGLISSGILNLMLYFRHDYVSMLILWGLNGIAQFAVWPAIVKIITCQLAPSDRKNGAFYIAFASIGGLLASYLTAALITRWEYNFLLSGIVLLALAALWVTECHTVDRYMVRDAEIAQDTPHKDTVPTGKLFARTGFYWIVLFFFFRTLVDQSIKAFSPTMLTELYPGVTPSLGNLLNVLIIGGTLLGAVLIRRVYPGKIRSEVTGMLVFSAVCIPCSVLMMFSGTIHIAIVVACLCIVSCFLNCGTVLVNCGNTHFGSYGKSATAAGIVNAAASIAFIFNSYGIALIADNFGWWAVLLTLLIFMGLTVALILPAVPRWRKFLKSKNQE